MLKKQSYEELEKRIEELEQVENELRQSKEKYRQLVEAANAAIFAVTYDGDYLFMNALAAQQIGGRPNDFLGQNIRDVFPQEIANEYISSIQNIINTGRVVVIERETILQGERRWYKTIGQPFSDSTAMNGAAMFVGIDETERKQAQDKIVEYSNNLEKMVEERTEELELQGMKLKETNIALKVLLKQHRKDKNDNQEQILSNIKKLVIPYIDILKTYYNNNGQSILDALNSSINNIISDFSCNLSSEKYGLTPSEILVADLIRGGRKTKEIAELNNISHKTVEVHRSNIRKKIGISGKKINLQTYLSSLTN